MMAADGGAPHVIDLELREGGKDEEPGGQRPSLPQALPGRRLTFRLPRSPYPPGVPAPRVRASVPADRPTAAERQIQVRDAGLSLRETVLRTR
jgi:hypothetical protein